MVSSPLQHQIAPPTLVALFLVNVLPVIVNEDPVEIFRAPPLAALLLLKMQLLRLKEE